MEVRRVAVVQARMGSTRLPGKVLELINDEPILLRIVNRLHKCETLDEVVIATSTLPADNPIEELAWANGIRCIRGSEGDVLSRYALAARETKADVVVRITSDCPLISPEVTDEVVRSLSGSYDLASNAIPLERSYPRGLDTEAAWADVVYRLDRWIDQIKTPHREHVFTAAYMKDDPVIGRTQYESLSKFFKTRIVKQGEDFSEINWCVDTPQDLIRVRRLVALYGDLPWRELVEKELAEAA